MKRKHPFEIEKVTINLRKGDFARLRELHPQIGAGPAIARLIMGYLARIEAGMQEKGLVESVETEA